MHGEIGHVRTDVEGRRSIRGSAQACTVTTFPRRRAADAVASVVTTSMRGHGRQRRYGDRSEPAACEHLPHFVALHVVSHRDRVARPQVGETRRLSVQRHLGRSSRRDHLSVVQHELIAGDRDDPSVARSEPNMSTTRSTRPSLRISRRAKSPGRTSPNSPGVVTSALTSCKSMTALRAIEIVFGPVS